MPPALSRRQRRGPLGPNAKPFAAGFRCAAMQRVRNPVPGRRPSLCLWTFPVVSMICSKSRPPKPLQSINTQTSLIHPFAVERRARPLDSSILNPTRVSAFEPTEMPLASPEAPFSVGRHRWLPYLSRRSAFCAFLE